MADYFQNLGLFAVLLFGIIAIPGTDMLYLVGSSLTHGIRKSTWALVGVLTGGAVHTVIAGLGLSALIIAFPWALQAILVLCGSYMAVIGIGMVRHASPVRLEPGAETSSAKKMALTGMAICLLNPKAYMFTFAILPGFVRPEFGALWMQFVVIGVMVVAMQLTVYGGAMILSGGVRQGLSKRPELAVRFQRFMGVLLTAFAAWTVARGIG